MANNELEFLSIETYVLKMHINCQGCRNKVKKLLRKIEGVYAVKIDSEGEKVMVSGTVDPNTLVNKLVRSGKHAELVWSPSSIQEQALPLMPIKDYSSMNRNQLLQQQYLMNPHDHHFSGSLNLSPSLPFGSEFSGQCDVDPNLMMPLPMPVGGDGYDFGNGRGYRFPDLSSQDYPQYGYGDHHQSPMAMTMPMVMNNRYYNNPLQSPMMMYGGNHMMHQPYAADYKSSLISPYSHHSFSIPAPYTYY